MRRTDTAATIPSDPRQRRAWVIFQLNLKGLSFAELGRRNGTKRSAPRFALDNSYPRMERVIAEAVGVSVRQLWPERFDAHGNRLPGLSPRYRKKGPLQKPTRAHAARNVSEHRAA